MTKGNYPVGETEYGNDDIARLIDVLSEAYPEYKLVKETLPGDPYSEVYVLKLACIEPSNKIYVDPLSCTTEDVIEYLGETDPSLRDEIQKFREHNIDGGSFLLLTLDVMIKYMNIKVGPALRIRAIVNSVRDEFIKDYD